MGRSITPKYAVEFLSVRTVAGSVVGWTPMAWNSGQSGRPNAVNLAAFIRGYEASTLPYGVNSHLGATVVLAARIVRQADKTVIADYNVEKR